jgi:hypothetical protein
MPFDAAQDAGCAPTNPASSAHQIHSNNPLVALMRVTFVVVMMGVLTGLRRAFSTPRLAGMAATELAVAELDPVVARQKPQLAPQGHLLPQVGEKEGPSWHLCFRVATTGNQKEGLSRNAASGLDARSLLLPY